MARGRKPKPTVLKLLAGNPGCRPLKQNEPKPTVGLPLCPEWIDDDAKREWNSIVPELNRMGLLTVVDHAALAGYCQAFADFKDAVTILRRDGKTVTNGQGTIISHPAIAMKNKAAMMMHKFLSEFGLSPSSRTRIKSDTQEPKDELEEFLRSA